MKNKMLIDKIEFFNAGSYENPAFGMKITGRNSKDYKTPIEKVIVGIEAEDLENTINNIINKRLGEIEW